MLSINTQGRRDGMTKSSGESQIERCKCGRKSNEFADVKCIHTSDCDVRHIQACPAVNHECELVWQRNLRARTAFLQRARLFASVEPNCGGQFNKILDDERTSILIAQSIEWIPYEGDACQLVQTGRVEDILPQVCICNSQRWIIQIATELNRLWNPYIICNSCIALEDNVGGSENEDSMKFQ